VKSCPNECTGHGTCGVEGNCSCHTSWTGDDCSTRYVVHGVLLDDGQDGVKCFPDWGGPDCNTRLCPKNCSKNGVCVAGQCACYAGWAGRLCQHPACENECYYHGECKQGVCECDVGYHGRDCSQVREVVIIHVVGTRGVPSSTGNIMKIHARITLTVEFIRPYFFIFILCLNTMTSMIKTNVFFAIVPSGTWRTACAI
jgi:hypothetical protein